jgi:opacity protein-like surface antigen
MQRYQQYLLAISIFATSTSLALAEAFPPYFELILMGGQPNQQVEDFSLSVVGSEVDEFVQTNQGDWESWTAQLGVGYVYPLLSRWQTGPVEWLPSITPQINLYYLDGGDIKGDVYQFEMPELYDLNYTMDFDSARLMLDIELTVLAIERLSFYSIGGVGAAWNRINLSATPNQQGIDFGVQGYEIDTENSISFAYEFGGGLAFAASDEVTIALEYLYTGFPDVALGDSDDDGFDIKGKDLDIHSQAILLGLQLSL